MLKSIIKERMNYVYRNRRIEFLTLVLVGLIIK
ncbi:Uncharacterised protein [uncultured Clostridium sp.]|nr:Uncharacterised protein [uncultured Clostridium sp.]